VYLIVAVPEVLTVTEDGYPDMGVNVHMGAPAWTVFISTNPAAPANSKLLKRFTVILYVLMKDK
jgi:hypothetical protein